ncbi:hypothetical protein AKJ09_04698 [Labilithrix luteola]|uniref:Cytoplasmic protein n=1 Tax=Labilithrix luteola TaxID=1391654 RepID=A0A0K1PY09_9BACT|nr:crosslink repair DNA glycosylase YcaQ family protein [Labilithrix luteola]AKU98034.1 hypothetical protein AKJ09_04698 [Labilithrix luteola]
MPSALTLERLRRHAVGRSLFAPTSLEAAIDKLGFVQADPIRAPARAQDLTLRHRVAGYHAGDLERLYPTLSVEEDYFVNYGFMPRRYLGLMLPRTPRHPWDRTTRARAKNVLAFVKERGEVHPREVDQRFAHGSVTNYWGGSSNATTQLLERMHYRGLLRVVKREGGIRVYAARDDEELRADEARDPKAKAEALVAIAVAKYAPMPDKSLRALVSRLRFGAPQLVKALSTALASARRELPRAVVDGVTWYWPEGEDPSEVVDDADRVRLLAPFDPVVWDRHRFEIFWGWAYRFEAYTPQAKRKLGYYALPILWRSHVIGWTNVTAKETDLEVTSGYVAGRAPRDKAFTRGLAEELERMRDFLASPPRR